MKKLSTKIKYTHAASKFAYQIFLYDKKTELSQYLYKVFVMNHLVYFFV